MISSKYLYGELDHETAQLQYDLFMLKKSKAIRLKRELKLDLLDFSDEQKQIQIRFDKITKAITFCEGQIEEAKEVLNG